MDTPICDFVKEYAEKRPVRLHMPGHKGRSYIGIENSDITEIEGADVLYGARGIIKKSEDNASSLFGTAKTLYSTEGSSLCIRAMLFLTAINSDKKLKILAGRNAHKTFLSAAALTDAEIVWLYPEDRGLISGEINVKDVEKALSEEEGVAAVYITSPDYLGGMSDIEAIAEICHRYGVLCIVDNAHGAYLKFLPEDRHPITLGADMCCDSAHKTLPVLTGGAYLHISKGAPEYLAENAESAMAAFASTSPSYLILQSLDSANAYLCDYPHRLSVFVRRLECLKAQLTDYGYVLEGEEPLKLTIKTKPFGYTGREIAEILRNNGIETEFSDPDFTVCMFTPEISENETEKLLAVLTDIERKSAISDLPPSFCEGKSIVSLKRAFFSKKVKVPREKALGMVLADLNMSCPPAIPIITPGEYIDERAIELMKYYGIEECYVIPSHASIFGKSLAKKIVLT